jgi:hypothetical protein
VTTGPVTVDEVRARLGGATIATDDQLQEAIDVATSHLAALLDDAWADPATWPDDLHDGMAHGAVLAWRNVESPTSAPLYGQPWEQGPPAPPFAWDSKIRARLGAYTAAGVFVG